MRVREERGKEIGKERERMRTIRNLMETLGLTVQQAMDAIKIPHNEQGRYAAML